MPPKISLLILNYNGIRITPIILDSITKIKYPKEKIETIVIDNASTDGSVEMVEKSYPFAKIITLDKNSAYGAFNVALQQCTGEYCFFLNNDMEIAPDCLQELVKFIRAHPDAVMIGPAVYNLHSRKLMYTKKYLSRSFYQGADHFEELTEEMSAAKEVESYTGVPFVKTSFARSLDYVFDPDYFLFVEDIDLAYRIRLLGQRFYRAPTAKVYHGCNATTKIFFDDAKLNYLVERNTLQTFLKNVQFRNLVLWTPLVMGSRMLKVGYYTITFNFPLLRSTLNAWIWNFTNFKKIYAKRKSIQSSRRVSDSTVFREMGGEIPVLKYYLSSKSNNH